MTRLLPLLLGLLLPLASYAQPIADRACDPITEKSYWTDHLGGYFKCGVDRALPTITPATPARTLNTTFTPSATLPTLVSYTVEITCTATLVGGQTGSVELRSDTNATPTTGRGSVGNANSVSLAIALTAVNTQRAPITYLVPAGHNVRLVSSGTCSISLVGQTEEPLSQ